MKSIQKWSVNDFKSVWIDYRNYFWLNTFNYFRNIPYDYFSVYFTFDYSKFNKRSLLFFWKEIRMFRLLKLFLFSGKTFSTETFFSTKIFFYRNFFSPRKNIFGNKKLFSTTKIFCRKNFFSTKIILQQK